MIPGKQLTFRGKEVEQKTQSTIGLKNRSS